ncbi:hypothetical protein EXS56_02090, partial [Candidatus Kaiserbacteria bacterium]|nr:hypothetical protein [Candidatus Kaiserbacteria bacterium]
MTKQHHAGTLFSGTLSARKGWVLALVFFALVLFAASSHTQKPFASSEFKFTDASVNGLAIVPASCPSTPHGSEVCDVAVSNNCSLSATSGTITAGQSTTLQWSVTQPSYLAGL